MTNNLLYTVLSFVDTCISEPAYLIGNGPFSRF